MEKMVDSKVKELEKVLEDSEEKRDDHMNIDENFDDLDEELDILMKGEETPLKFETVTKADCNMILVLPKSFQVRPNQPSNLVGDIEDLSEPVVQIMDMKSSESRPTVRSITIEEDTDGGEMVVLRQPDNSTIKHLKSLYVKAQLNGRLVDKVLIDNGAIVNILPSKCSNSWIERNLNSSQLMC